MKESHIDYSNWIGLESLGSLCYAESSRRKKKNQALIIKRLLTSHGNSRTLIFISVITQHHLSPFFIFCFPWPFCSVVSRFIGTSTPRVRSDNSRINLLYPGSSCSTLDIMDVLHRQTNLNNQVQ